MTLLGISDSTEKPQYLENHNKQKSRHFRSFFAPAVSALVLVLVVAGPVFPAGYLDLVFEDHSPTYDADQLWVSFDNGGSARPFDVTYNNGAAVTIDPGNHLSDPLQLSTVTDQTFRINSVTSVAVFVSYGQPFTTLDASPSFFKGAVSADITFQNFEITRTGGAGDQGNLTNINYFTAPMSIDSYSSDYDSGNTALQSTGYVETTEQIGSKLSGLSPSNSVTVDGKLRRYLGPTSWTIDAPYPGFGDYLASVRASGVSNTIENHNAFNTNGATPTTGKNYDFTFSLTSAIAADNSIQLTGQITTRIKDNAAGTFTDGATYTNADITLSGADMSKLNMIIYGQTANPTALQSAVTWGSGWTEWADFVQDPANNLTDSFDPSLSVGELTVAQTAIGEIATAVLMGFLGNTTVVDGTALNDMPSEDWWKLDPMQAFSDIQANPDHYNQWANVIYNASDNSVYSLPYSDRVGNGPLVNTVRFNKDGIFYDIDRWVVGVGEPIHESSTHVAIWSEADSGNWTTAGNWNGGDGPAPTSGTQTTIIFDRATVTASNQNAATPYVLGALVFNDVADGFALSGGALNFSDGTEGHISNNDVDNHSLTVNNDLTLTNPTTLGGTSTGTTTLAGVLSGAGGLTVDGKGVYVLTGANTFTNDVEVKDGTLGVSADNNLGDAANTLTLNGTGILQAGGTFNTARTVTLSSANATVHVLAGQTFGLIGQVTGTGTLNTTGPGNVQLTETTNNWTGATSIGTGSTLQLGADNVVPDGSTVTVDGMFDLNEFNETIADLAGTGTVQTGDATLTLASAAGTFSGSLAATSSGAGLVDVAGGTWTLTGDNSAFDGTLRASGGATIAGTNANALTAGTGGMTLDNGSLELSGSFTNTTPIALAAGGGTLSATGGQAPTHNAAITNTGTLNITGDGATSLVFGAATTVVTTDVNILADGSLQVGGDHQLDAATDLDLAGGFILGAHSQTLNSLSGAGLLSIDGGTLTVNGAASPDIALGAGGGTLNAGGGTLSQNGDVSGAGGLAVTNGQVTMGTAPKSWTGPTTIQNTGILQADQSLASTDYTIDSGGQLNVGTSNALPTTSTVTNNGTLTNGANAQRLGQLDGTNAAATVTIGAGALHVANENDAAYAGSFTTGGGDLIKSGSGTWTLSGNSNLFDGTLEINSGTVLVTGTLGDATPIFTVSGTAGGTGVWAGTMNVNAGGIVAPGNSIGNMTVGTYNPASDSCFDVEVAAGGGTGAPDNDKLIVLVAANLNGKGIVRPILTEAIGNYAVNDTWTILDASGGVLNGEFQGLQSQSHVARFGLEYPGGGLVNLVFLEAINYASMASTGDQLAVAAALDRIGAGSGAGRFMPVFRTLNGLTLSGVQGALNDISPAQTTAGMVVQGEQTRMFTGGLRRHLDTQRDRGVQTTPRQAPETSRTNWLDMPMLATTASNQDALALSREEMPSEGETKAGNWALWFRVDNTWGDQHSTRAVPGYRYFTTNLTLGADHPVLPGIRAGVMMGYSYSEMNFDRHAGEGEIDALRMAVYGTARYKGFHADLAVGAGYDWYENTRNINFMGTEADSNHDGQEFLTYLGVGYDWTWGKLTIGPVASLQYLHMREEGYREGGAGVLNLEVDENSADSLQQTLGLRALYDITLENVTLTPQVRAEWLHEYQSEAQSLSARLGAPGGAFAVTGQDPASDAILLDGGVEVDFGQGLSLRLFYEWYQACNNDNASHTLSTALRYEF